jgi:hypothetical protein
MTFEIYLLIKVFPFLSKKKCASNEDDGKVFFLCFKSLFYSPFSLSWMFYVSFFYLLLDLFPIIFLCFGNFCFRFSFLFKNSFFSLSSFSNSDKGSRWCRCYKSLYFYDISFISRSFNWIPNSPFGKRERETQRVYDKRDMKKNKKQKNMRTVFWMIVTKSIKM